MPVGDGVERRGARRLDRDGARARPRRSSRSGGRSSSSNLYLRRRPQRTERCTCCRRSSTARPNPEADPARRRGSTRAAAARRGAAAPAPAATRRGAPRWSSCSRTSGMLPAIYFIFSRDRLRRRGRSSASPPGCGSPTADERDAHPRDRRATTSSALDRRRPRRARLRPAGSPGSRRASPPTTPGMVPPFKEAVEACFVDGPGEGRVRHRDAGARHQHAGPLGRDREAVEVHRRAPRVPDAGRVHPAHRPGRPARHRRRRLRVVLWSPFVPFDQVAGAGVEPHASRSRRRSARPTTWPPTWCARYPPRRGPPPAQPVVRPVPGRRATSCAWRRSSSARTASSPRRGRDAECDRGDVDEYRGLLAAAEEARRPRGRHQGACRASRSARLKPGDVIVLPGGKSGGACAVLSTSHRRRRRRARRRRHPNGHATSRGAPPTSPPRPGPSGTVELPVPYTPTQPRLPAVGRRRAATGPSCARSRRPTASSDLSRRDRGPGAALAELGSPSRSRRAPTCDRHLRAAGRAERLEQRRRRLERRIRGRTESLARQFDRVLRVLEAWGYVDGWALTEAGRAAGPAVPRERPAGGRGAARRACSTTSTRPRWPGWSPCFTYEHRGQGRASGAVVPVGGGAASAGRESSGWRRSSTRPRTRPGCRSTRLPDAGFVALGLRWAAGDDLDDVIDDEEMSGGDFVRNVKQLIDLLRQIAQRRRSDPRRRRGGHRRPTGCSAASSPRRRPSAREADPRARSAPECRDDPEGRGVGRTRARCRRTAWWWRATHEAGRCRRAGAARGPARTPPLGLLGGDLCRTLGGTGGPTARRLRTDRGRHLSRRPRRGARRRPAALLRRPPGGAQPLVACAFVAMNAQWLGRLEPRAPRPSQRRPPRHLRRPARHHRRPQGAGPAAPTGAHLPHPGIKERRVPAAQVGFDRPLTVWLDGVRLGPAHSLLGAGRARRLDRRRLSTPPFSERFASPWRPRSSRERVVRRDGRRRRDQAAGGRRGRAAGRRARRRVPRDPQPPGALLRGALRLRSAGVAAARARAWTSSAAPTGSRQRSWPAPAAATARRSRCSASTTRSPASATRAGTTSSRPRASAPGWPQPRSWPRLGGRLVVMGTPAEEGGGGKVLMGDAGAFDGVDAAMMVHPAGVDLHRDPRHRHRHAGRSSTTARRRTRRRSRTGGATPSTPPCSATMNVAALRQHIRPTERVHGVFTRRRRQAEHRARPHRGGVVRAIRHHRARCSR